MRVNRSLTSAVVGTQYIDTQFTDATLGYGQPYILYKILTVAVLAKGPKYPTKYNLKRGGENTTVLESVPPPPQKKKQKHAGDLDSSIHHRNSSRDLWYHEKNEK